MNRADFGHWGASLSADDFARALAAAGVLAAGEAGAVHPPGPDAVFGRLRAALESVEPGGLVRWRPPVAPLPDADMLAAMWGDAIGLAGRPFRLVIEGLDPSDSPIWLVETLGRDAIGPASIFIAPWTPPQPVASVGWSWPVDIGLLPDDRSRTLGTSISADLMLETIIDVHQIGPEHEACNLLLLPYDLRDALIHALATPVRASCVVVLGAGNEPWERMRPMLETLVSHARASAIVVAAVPDHQRTEWLGALMQELSQDAGLDVALHRATPGRPPLVVAPEDMLQRTRMGPVVRELEEMSMAMPPDVGAEIADAVSGAFEDADLPEPRFRGLLPTFGVPGAFSPPPSHAERIAEATRSARRAAPDPELRFLRARITEPNDTDNRVTILEPNARYDVRVSIGPMSDEWIEATAAFPDREIFTGDEQEHRLRVFFTDLTMQQEPLSQEMTLPRTGTSREDAVFPLVTGNLADPVEARIIVTHRNRVLQTLKLRARLGEPDGVSLVVEAAPRTRLDDLEGRSRFDLAMIVNHTDRGERCVTAVQDDHVRVRWPPQLDQTVTNIRGFLEDRVTRDVDTLSPDSEEMREFLVKLARFGAELAEQMRRRFIGPDFDKLREPERIQVVCDATNGYFPIEFVYDLVAPKMNATLCPDVVEMLQSRKKAVEGRADSRSLDMPETCAGCRARQDNSPREQAGYICPFGFWGLSKVIERHAFDIASGDTVTNTGSNFLLYRKQPLTGRKTLGPFDRVVFAASSKVDNYKPDTISNTVNLLKTKANGGFGQATTWEMWTDKVEEVAPQLLVILPHTSMEGLEPTMEVGHEQVLSLIDVHPWHVAGRDDMTPIVLLLGCETSSLDIPIIRMPTKFQDRGAAIVLSTLTSVLGRHAAPIACAITEALHSVSAGEARSFGEVMRRIRQEGLWNGNPMALTLAAYGDADWQFGA